MSSMNEMSAVDVVLSTGMPFLRLCLNFIVLMVVVVLFSHAPCPTRHAQHNGGNGEEKHEIDKENHNVGEKWGVELGVVDEGHVEANKPKQSENYDRKGYQNYKYDA